MNSQNSNLPPSQGRRTVPRRPNPGPPSGNWLPSRRRWLLWCFLVAVAGLWLWAEVSRQARVRTIPYSQFRKLVAQRRVAHVMIQENEITGQMLPLPGAAAGATNAPATNGTAAAGASTNALQSSSPTNAAAAFLTQPTPFQTVRVDDPDLVQNLEKAHISFRGERSGPLTQLLWFWVVPIVVFVLIWRFFSRRMANLGRSVMGFGSSRARLVAEQDSKITFNDVAGCDEAKHDLQEVVAFLRDPNRYKSLGATIPKGILLVGPPGTGKTLLARAVAGEARVPFFLISGSDFVEMFVGVGAARVRDLFKRARTSAPCIVFIDELDAVGRQRGVRMGSVNDEREQTLNQLLVGMDGFEANAGVIILAATNRPEVLDRALLRPGRFDRHVAVDIPDFDGRLAILKLHVRAKRMSPDANLRRLAAQTPGFSGADLANAVNEAALLAASRGAQEVNQHDLESAIERVVAGPERRSRRLSEEEKTRVAYHETGHALVAAYSPHADPVHKISIIPHGHAALGYTLQLPVRDQYLMSRSGLLDKIKGMLAGRAAEEVVFNEISTGAENDLQHATALARRMVAIYGMSQVIGLAHCARREGQFEGAAPEVSLARDCSEQTAREIDEEVKKILNQAYNEAKVLLREHREELETISGELLAREVMDAKAFDQFLKKPPASAATASPRPSLLVEETKTGSVLPRR